MSLKGGLNVSSVAGLQEYDDLTAFHIGVGGKKDLTNSLSLRHEVIFSVQGARAKGSGAHLLFHYVNMPVLLNVHSGAKLSFDVGPQLGVAIRAIEKTGLDVDKTANLETFELSLCVGANYLITDRFYADVRFNRGVTNASRLPGSDAFYNAVFQASIGYYFNLKEQDPQ